MLGRIQPAHFPAVFGPQGDQPLDPEAVRARLRRASPRRCRDRRRRAPEQVAAGFLEIAVLNMANAVKKISVQRGHDVTRYALTSFGGAGGQHACAVADELGIRTVLVPPLAGVLSAYGIGLADATALREQSVEGELTEERLADVRDLCARLERQTEEELRADGIPEQASHDRPAPATVRRNRRHADRPAGRRGPDGGGLHGRAPGALRLHHGQAAGGRTAVAEATGAAGPSSAHPVTPGPGEGSWGTPRHGADVHGRGMAATLRLYLRESCVWGSGSPGRPS